MRHANQQSMKQTFAFQAWEALSSALRGFKVPFGTMWERHVHVNSFSSSQAFAPQCAKPKIHCTQQCALHLAPYQPMRAKQSATKQHRQCQHAALKEHSRSQGRSAPCVSRFYPCPRARLAANQESAMAGLMAEWSGCPRFVAGMSRVRLPASAPGPPSVPKNPLP